jgi:hypothetical protein
MQAMVLFGGAAWKLAIAYTPIAARLGRRYSSCPMKERIFRRTKIPLDNLVVRLMPRICAAR